MIVVDPVLRLILQTLSILIEKDRVMTAKTDELAAAIFDIQNTVVPAVASKIDEIMAALAAAKSGQGTIEDPAAIDAAIAALQTVKADLLGKVAGAAVA